MISNRGQAGPRSSKIELSDSFRRWQEQEEDGRGSEEEEEGKGGGEGGGDEEVEEGNGRGVEEDEEERGSDRGEGKGTSNSDVEVSEDLGDTWQEAPGVSMRGAEGEGGMLFVVGLWRPRLANFLRRRPKRDRRHSKVGMAKRKMNCYRSLRFIEKRSW